MFFSGVSQVSFNSEETQALFESWGPGYHPVVSKFVQNSEKLLRLIDSNGEVQNGLRICSGGAFWWDDVPYMPCPIAHFRIVPL